MIETLEQLRSLYAQPAERALRKQQPLLDAHCRHFIALSPFCVVASAGAATAQSEHVGQGGALLDQPQCQQPPDAMERVARRVANRSACLAAAPAGAAPDPHVSYGS